MGPFAFSTWIFGGLFVGTIGTRCRDLDLEARLDFDLRPNDCARVGALADFEPRFDTRICIHKLFDFSIYAYK
jgi:hypothetical protein